MANVRTLQHSFAGGEVCPELYGRIDDTKYQSGLATCRNFITKPQGPAMNRPGFGFVREVKDSDKATRLIPFTYSTTQTMVIELGAGYFRFHSMGGTLMNGGVPYEVANPYAVQDLFNIKYVQSADVLTLVHPKYAPKELRRYGATDWRLVAIDFTPTIAAPGAPTITVNLPSGVTLQNAQNFSYVVTSVAADKFTESPASAAGTVSSNVYQTGVTNTISWAAVSGASAYNVYKLQGGLYGYIGQTSGTSIVDNNIFADMSKTPPVYENVFQASGDYPGCVSYFEQRRVFAGTTNQPQNIWMTKSGTESTMSYCLPVRDDDRVAFRVAAREANTIRHIVPLTQLVLLTSGGEWKITSNNNDAITPTSISVRPQSYVGASNVQPLVVNNAMIYEASRGGHMREMAYNWQASGFVSGDISIRAPHLFDNLAIIDMAYSKAPIPIVWAVSSNGNLLGNTYIPDQQIVSWHRHDTDGVFESCCVVSEGSEDVLYTVVKRTIGGVQKRYVERMASHVFTDSADAFFVDCGLTYSGAPTSTISGLSHIEGKTVNILADGAVHPQRVVTGGVVTLDHPASKVHVGLPITADLQTLPVAGQIDSAYGQGRAKNVNKAWLRVYQSGGIFIGPDPDHLVEAKQRTNEPYGSPPRLKTAEIPLVLTPQWGDNGQVFVRQTAPLPLTCVSLTLEVALGA